MGKKGIVGRGNSMCLGLMIRKSRVCLYWKVGVGDVCRGGGGEERILNIKLSLGDIGYF